MLQRHRKDRRPVQLQETDYLTRNASNSMGLMLAGRVSRCVSKFLLRKILIGPGKARGPQSRVMSRHQFTVKEKYGTLITESRNNCKGKVSLKAWMVCDLCDVDTAQTTEESGIPDKMPGSSHKEDAGAFSKKENKDSFQEGRLKPIVTC